MLAFSKEISRAMRELLSKSPAMWVQIILTRPFPKQVLHIPSHRCQCTTIVEQTEQHSVYVAFRGNLFATGWSHAKAI